MSEETNQLTPAPLLMPPAPPDQLLVGPIETEGDIEIWPDTSSSQFLTCLDPECEEYMLLNAEGKADHLWWDHCKEPVEVRSWYAHKVKVTDMKTGELVSKTRLVCFTPDGVSYSTTSSSACGRWHGLLAKKGNGPFSPPLLVEGRQVPRRGAEGHYLDFRFLPRPAIVGSPLPESQPEIEVKRTKRAG